MALRAFAAALLWLAAAQGREPEGFSPAYDALVARYARGDREAALREVGTWLEGPLKLELKGALFLRSKADCVGCPELTRWAELPIAAAVMLHTDRAEIDRLSGHPSLHLPVAEAWAKLLVDEPRRRDFARRWYLAMCARAFARYGWDEGADWARKGLRAFPADPDLLLALAAIEESAGSRPIEPKRKNSLDHFDTVRRDEHERLVRLREAVDLLNQLLAAQPASEEARLRLGRVSWRMKRSREARAAFAWILERDSSREARYLARLFLGRVEEDAGHDREAAASYRAALDLLPNSQAASLALSHVLYRLGDDAGSRRLVDGTLAAGTRRTEDDPFWVYPWGPAARLETLLKELRREVSS